MSQKRSGPRGLFSRAEDKLKLSDDEIEDPFRWSVQFVELYCVNGHNPLGALPNRIADSSSTKAVTFIRSHNKALSVAAMCVCNTDRSPVGSQLLRRSQEP